MMTIQHAYRVMTTYGLEPEPAYDDDDIVAGPLMGIAYDGEGFHVMAFSGSWPFVNEQEMGSFLTIEEAARYASWLIKREAFYQDRDQRIWESQFEDQEV